MPSHQFTLVRIRISAGFSPQSSVRGLGAHLRENLPDRFHQPGTMQAGSPAGTGFPVVWFDILKETFLWKGKY